MRGTLKYVTLFLALLIAVPLGTIYRQNIEVWAAQNGLDSIIAEGSLPSDLYGPMLLLGFIFLLGATAALWAEYWLRKRFPARFSTKGLELIEGKTFRHDRVVVDGKKYLRCSFDGVTFVYRGTALYGFKDCNFSGSFSIRMDHPAAEAALVLFLQAHAVGGPIIPVSADSPLPPPPGIESETQR